jgi:broad specificity phosphatase PhoE
MFVFVLRHADRKPEPLDDLTPSGEERAELLARMLMDCDATVAFRSEFVRARRTLDPLKRRLGDALKVNEIRLGNTAARVHVERTIEAIRSQPASSVIVVVGHSNTIGPIVENLGGDAADPIGPEEFDRLFILFMRSPSDQVTQLRLRYGAPT